MKIVHITTHLGGGVGRIISSLIQYRQRNEPKIKSIVITLEETEKQHICDSIIDSGVSLVSNPSVDDLMEILKDTDIIQLEWWHHPLMAGWLIEHASILNSRIVIWSHISGSFYPQISKEWLLLPDAFVFTAPYKHSINVNHRNIIDLAYSCGSFDDIPERTWYNKTDKLSYCYMGTLNPAKLHPDIIKFISAVEINWFKLEVYGDVDPEFPIEQLAYENRIDDRVSVHGYTHEPYKVLSSTDVFVYLLNREHYGTTENVLLEAMACGAIPVVLNNPVEMGIVEHLKTGMVVNSPEEFDSAIAYLAENPDKRELMSKNARNSVIKHFSLKQTSDHLINIYQQILNNRKRNYNFASVMGKTPGEWFQFGLGEHASLFLDSKTEQACIERLRHPMFYEFTKSSVFHFLNYYPDDLLLKKWGNMLQNDKAYS